MTYHAGSSSSLLTELLEAARPVSEAVSKEWHRVGPIVQASVGLLSLAWLVRKLKQQQRKTITTTSPPSPPKYILYTNPLCPYAHRVWLTLQELDLVQHTQITPIPLQSEINRAADSALQALPEWASQVGVSSPTALKQLKEWYTLNFGRTVPVLLVGDEVIKESDIICEYLATVSHKLLPSSPLDVVRLRQSQKALQPALLYNLLTNQDPAMQPALLQDVLHMIDHFSSFMASSQHGPYYLGDQFSLCDVLAIPFFARFAVTLQHYRGIDLVAHSPVRFQIWFRACHSRPAVQHTLPSSALILQAYKHYAAGGGK